MTARATSLDRVFRGLRSASERQHGRGALFLRDGGHKITEALITDLIASGIDPAAIKTEQAVTESAGYRLRAYRWDLVIIKNGVPAAVIEWKILGHANNFNNRLNEITAAATNLRISFERTGTNSFRPLLAVLYIDDLSRSEPRSRHSLDVFAARLHNMVSDRLLDCACVLSFDSDSQSLIDLNDDLAFDQFATTIGSHMRSTAIGPSPGSDGAINLGKLLSTGDVAGVVTGLASTSVGLSAVEAAVIASRRNKIADMQALAATEGTTETVMHRAIANNYWIFGGQYIGIAPRRDFALLDQHDYPLLCADGSIHIVELKGPGCVLVRRYRNHYIVSNEVHEATSQCLNYLRSLDEQGPALQATYRNELGIDIDFRRARGTVVIGHPGRSEASAAASFQIVQTIRSYNAHLSRIQVITYTDLLDSADRALRFESLTEDKPTST